MQTNVLMRNTNERIHSSVRVRLDLGGLGLDDHGPYKCHALLHRGWALTQMQIRVHDPIPWNATWGPTVPPADVRICAVAASLVSDHHVAPTR